MQFPDEQRRIFSYHDGAGVVHGDPLELHRRVCFLLGDPSKVVDEVCSADAAGADEHTIRQAMAASEKLCGAIRTAFQMVEFDRKTGQGATESQCFGVWNAFCAHLAELKKKPASPLTSSPPTA